MFEQRPLWRQSWLAGMAVACQVVFGGSAMAIDLAPLWDHARPAVSEERFRAALATASGDDALVLRTQIARTWGIRREFDKAREMLDGLRPEIDRAGAEPRVRWQLEWGRTWVSATHTPQQRTPQALAQARAAYAQALDMAQAAGLDGLAVDAVHMMAFVDTAPADQLKWNERGLAIARTSTQPAAKAWEASLRNNQGVALKELGRLDDALAEFRQALVLREAQGQVRGIRIAHWMIAWTLRAMGRLDEAREIQLRLEREWDADGQPDPYVFEELQAIYQAQGNEARARHYAERHRTSRTP